MLKLVSLFICLLFWEMLHAHQPELSSLMIYEQNGKSILLIKSSLNAFEGEIKYNFKKRLYKTPEEFNELVSQYFQTQCVVIANGDTLKFFNIQVQLGHETTLFAEMEKMPDSIRSLYLSSTLFKDMPNNQCELILTIKGMQQKQFILNNENDHQIALILDHNTWIPTKVAKAFYRSTTFLFGSTLLLIVIIVAAYSAMKAKRQSAG